MFEHYFLILLLGTLGGIVVGLLPGFTMGTAALILVTAATYLNFTDALIILMGVSIGSQFFGSITTILTGIPGESSSLCYAGACIGMTDHDKMYLIKNTAYGSAIGSVVGLAMFVIIYYAGLINFVLGITGFTTMFVISMGALLVVILIGKSNRWTTILLIVLGLLIAEKTYRGIPVVFQQIQNFTNGISIFSLATGLLVIPLLFDQYLQKKTYTAPKVEKLSAIPLSWKTIFHGTFVGAITGWVPGNPSTTSATVAFQSNKGDLLEKIISACSADNIAIILSFVFFLLIGIPVTTSEVMLLNLFNAQMVTIPERLFDPVIFGANTIDVLVMSMVIYIAIFWTLSFRFLSEYLWFVLSMLQKIKIIFVALILILFYQDINYTGISPIEYFSWLVIITALGISLHRRSISSLPILFAFIMGDRLIWSVVQFKYVFI